MIYHFEVNIMIRIPLVEDDTISLEELKLVLKSAPSEVIYKDHNSQCNSGCGDGCPLFSGEETEYTQAIGCLPSPFQIAEMRAVDGITWGCHSNPGVPCKSGLLFLKDLGLPYKVRFVSHDL
jgi:hypothetical protein